MPDNGGFANCAVTNQANLKLFFTQLFLIRVSHGFSMYFSQKHTTLLHPNIPWKDKKSYLILSILLSNLTIFFWLHKIIKHSQFHLSENFRKNISNWIQRMNLLNPHLKRPYFYNASSGIWKFLPHGLLQKKWDFPKNVCHLSCGPSIVTKICKLV